MVHFTSHHMKTQYHFIRSPDRSSDLSAGRFGEEIQGRDGLQRGQLCHCVCSHGGEMQAAGIPQKQPTQCVLGKFKDIIAI